MPFVTAFLEWASRRALPAGRTPVGSSVQRGAAVPVAPSRGVASEVGRGLSLELVSDSAHPAIWHVLMASEHPRGAGPLVGCQLRRPVGSDHGWLGGVEVAASALHQSAWGS